MNLFSRQPNSTASLSDGFRAHKSVLTFLLMAFICVVYFPTGMGELYQANYCVDTVGLLIAVGVLLNRYAYNDLNLFEPLVYCTVIYAAMFFFMPMYDICTNQILWFGFDFFQYGITASCYAIIGYLSFIYFYFCQNKGLNVSKRPLRQDFVINSRHAPILIVAMYSMSLSAKLYYLIALSGNSIAYILTFGLFGSSGGETIEAQIGFVNMLSYCLPALTLLYLDYGRSRTLKILFLYLMIMTQMADGFRFIIVETAYMLLAYYCLRKGKQPRIRALVFAAIILLIPIFAMTLFRNSVRDGSGIDLSTLFSINVIDVFDDAIFFNLRIYNNYYGLLGVVPSLYPYQYFNMIIKRTILMVVPHAIWPSKYDGFVSPGIEVYYGGPFLGTGQAYPNLGEFYLAFGIIGVIAFMGLFGFWMGRLKRRLSLFDDPTELIIYISVVANCLQLIIRGYTPSNFWLVVFSVLPVYIIRFVCSKREKSNNLNFEWN